MALRYLAVAVLAAGATYFGTTMFGRAPTHQASQTVVQACTFKDDAGDPLTIGKGPLGPRLGSLDYIASNLTQSEKIELVTSKSFNGTGVLEKMATDIVHNRSRVANDIYDSVRKAITGGP